MLKIYIARHGQDLDNLNGILNGHRDQLLTEKGVEQANEVAGKIKEAGITLDIVYSSPLKRALETAEIISKTLGASKPVIEPLLIERNFGVMTGQKVADIEKMCSPDILRAEIITYFLKVKNGETFPEVLSRAKVLLDKIKIQHKDGSVLLVTHGDIGKMIYASYYNLDWQNVLLQFHFGNGELILLSPDSPAGDAHVFRVLQYNH